MLLSLLASRISALISQPTPSLYHFFPCQLCDIPHVEDYLALYRDSDGRQAA